jgi:hypothetical protein
MRPVIIRVFMVLVVCASGAWAQALAGSGAVTGFVLESGADGMPEAAVTVANPALGVRRQAVTTDDGAFEIPGLPPGTGYQLKVERKNFASWESKEFEIGVGQTRSFRIDLQREKPATDVDVETMSTPVVENETGITTWVDPRGTKSLPSDQRRLEPLVLLAPMTGVENATGRITFQGEARSNSFLSDGITTTNGYFGESPKIAGPLTQDTTQEMRVLSSTYPAEFGRATGGVVDAVTPSAPNNFHGAIYDYLRPSDWEAGSRFAPGEDMLLKRNQGGGNFGGPILRDRLMFFGNVESMTDNFNGLNQLSTPTLAANCTATATQCAAAKNFIQSQANVLTPFRDHWTSGLGRIDYRRSEANTVNVEFRATNASTPVEAERQMIAPNGGLLGLQNSAIDTRYGKVGWTSAPTPSSVNELRLGLVENRYSEPSSASGPAITLAGASIGAAHPNFTALNEHRYELVDNLTMTSGSHTLRIGADLSRTRDNLNMLDSAGTYTYPTLTAFAQDFSGGTSRSYTNFTQQFGNAIRQVPYKELAAYAQDTWKAIPRVDITVGVRWDKEFLAQPAVSNPDYYQTGTIPSSNIAFAPRISLAYRFSDETVLRVGYGWFYAPYTGQQLDALLNGNGLTQTSITINPNQTNSPVFPRLLTFGTSAGASNLMYPVSKLRNPHTQQTSLAIERQISRETTLTVSVVDSRATKLWTADDINLTAPVKSAAYPILDATSATVSSYSTSIWTNRNDPRFAHIWEVGNGGWSHYDAANVELRRRMSHGLSVQALYTWSHATGINTGPLVNGAFPLISTPMDGAADKADLPTDQRHRAVLNWTWQPTLMRGNSWMARYLVNGWQLSGIASAASGQPVTPTVLLTGNQFSTLTMLYFSTLNGAGGWNRVPFQGVSSLYTDGQRNVDARLGRSIPITERIQGAVAIEAFNLFNTQRITSVNTIAYTAVAALPTGLVNGPYSGVLKPVPGVGQGNAASPARQLQVSFRVTF